MRMFFALLLENHAKNFVFKEMGLIQKKCIDGRFTTKNNLHVTVEFIGETNELELIELQKVLHSISFDGFEVQTTGLGGFYNKASKAILYLGIKTTQALQELHLYLKEKLTEQSFVLQDKPFVPHITLARKVQFKEDFLLKTFEFPTMMLTFSKLSLMESINLDGELLYREIDHVNFK
ncbi:MAG: RNA 2',3'-cyclic phosphodiesterase [Firmicutes bacterium]|nr:RNA 2',3'-cyclic phosphodiesterase [Bacillota bacterium]